jgi:hypothetical protein
MSQLFSRIENISAFVFLGNRRGFTPYWNLLKNLNKRYKLLEASLRRQRKSGKK